MLDVGGLLDDYVVNFTSVDKDILGNNVYTEYKLTNIDNEITISYESKSRTNHFYSYTNIIENLKSIKRTSSGIIELSNVISKGDQLEAISKEGFKLKFSKIINYEVKRCNSEG